MEHIKIMINVLIVVTNVLNVKDLEGAKYVKILIFII
jgi:hypothetical protein